MQQFISINKLFTVLFFVAFIFSAAQAQDAAVRGFVYEASTGEPVIFSNVYLNGTSHGGSTDINGYFSITKVPPGDYIMLVTFLGYDTLREPITLVAGDVLNKRFNLTEGSVSLGTVNITADRWKQEMRPKLLSLMSRPEH